MPMQQSHTYRIRTTCPTTVGSQRTDQKCSKRVTVSQQKKFKFFLPFSLRRFNFSTPPHNRSLNSWTNTSKIYTESDLTSKEGRRPLYNSVLPQLAVKCKIETECYYQTFVQVDGEVLRDRQLW